jgi:DNA invertase Pin-like site-specific DNA recombinase
VDFGSPQEELIVTIMVELAQFGREQTSERTNDPVFARARNRGWLFGI